MSNSTKIVLITGGSRGLGRNAALAIAKNGQDVILTYRTEKEKAEEVLLEIEKLGQKGAVLQLDVGVVGSFDTFFDQVKQVLNEKWNRDHFDFLVNNGGMGGFGMVAHTEEEVFDQLMNVHFKGTYFLTQKALPLLADGGGIINMSSGLARFSIPGYSAYAAMKGAMEVFTNYLAKELGERGIRANTVAPGPIDTDFNRQAFDADPGVKDYIASQTALGRVGEADDIGGVVAFLCSEGARWVNAQRIEASGGIFI